MALHISFSPVICKSHSLVSYPILGRFTSKKVNLYFFENRQRAHLKSLLKSAKRMQMYVSTQNKFSYNHTQLTAIQWQSCDLQYALSFYVICTNEYSLHFLWTLVCMYNRHTSNIMFQLSCTKFQHTCFRLRGDRRGTPTRYYRGGPTRRWNSKALCQPR